MKNQVHAFAAAILVAASLLTARDASAGTAISPFTYQGKLNQNGVAATGNFDLRFALYDAAAGGNLVGTPVVVANVPVVGGVFTVSLDLGAVFTGPNYWMQIGVRPVNTGDFVILSPLQAIAPTPYAFYSRAGNATSVTCTGCVGNATLAPGAVSGAKISSVGATAGQALVFNGSSVGWQSVGGGFSLPYSGTTSASATGFLVTQNTKTAIAGIHGNPGIDPVDSLAGVQGASDAGYGVIGDTSAPGSAGVYGLDFSGSAETAGVRGVSAWGVGLEGTGQIAGVHAKSFATPSIEANLATHDYAGEFYGNVRVFGNVITGVSTIRMDHPLDPANQTLSLAGVSSPEMLAMTSGNAQLDALGQAVVELPAYFEALVSDVRYQLTAVGAPAPGLYVAEPLADGRFRIAGGPKHGKVSWQLTGVRRDALAKTHPLVVEKEKPEAEKGFYEDPEAHGEPASRSVRNVRMRGTNR